MMTFRFLFVAPLCLIGLAVACDDASIGAPDPNNPRATIEPAANPVVGPTDGCFGYYRFGHPLDLALNAYQSQDEDVFSLNYSFEGVITWENAGGTGSFRQFVVQANGTQGPGITGNAADAGVTFLDGYSGNLMARGDRVFVNLLEIRNRFENPEISIASIRFLNSGEPTTAIDVTNCATDSLMINTMIRVEGVVDEMDVEMGDNNDIAFILHNNNQSRIQARPAERWYEGQSALGGMQVGDLLVAEMHLTTFFETPQLNVFNWNVYTKDN